MDKYKISWLFIRITLIIIAILIFTPVVTPKGVFTPDLFGIPYTLWMGMIVYSCFVALIFLGISVHARLFPEQKND